jgi:hypothetical protein
LLRLDPWQALATRVGAIGVSCSGLAFDADRDILYCSDRELVRLDLDTGRGRRIGPLGFTAVNGLAFQKQTGTLYGTDAVQKTLIAIDTNSGKGTALGSLRPQSNLSETEQPPAYLRNFLARFSEKPVPLSAEQIRGIEGEPPLSLQLKTSFEEKTLANRALEARVSRRELTRTLYREADLVLCLLPRSCAAAASVGMRRKWTRRGGRRRHRGYCSGWVAIAVMP